MVDLLEFEELEELEELEEELDELEEQEAVSWGAELPSGSALNAAGGWKLLKSLLPAMAALININS